jgi:hypothetical protein
MAGNADRGTTGRTGPMARRPAAGRPRPDTGRPDRMPLSIEVDTTGPSMDRDMLAAAGSVPIPPDILPRTLHTQTAYRSLITSGFSGQDAAGLIGYAVGLPPCGSRWSLTQINRLLFLRALYSNADWGEAERRPA